MKPGMTSTRDLNPLVIKFLSDKQWHPGSEIMMKISDEIMHERAYRFYQSMNKRRLEDKDNSGIHTYDEKVSRGRRRGAYLCMQHLTHSGLVVVKSLLGESGKAIEFEAREYMISDKALNQPVKEKKQKVKKEQKVKDTSLLDYENFTPIIQAPKDPVPNIKRSFFLWIISEAKREYRDSCLSSEADRLDVDNFLRECEKKANDNPWKEA